MKKFYQKLSHVLTLESGDERNPTGMKLDIWKFNCGTAVLVLMTQSIKVWDNEFWVKIKTVQGVNNVILKVLVDLNIISNKKNLDYSKKYERLIKNQDNPKEREDLRYFVWTAKTFPI